MLDLTLQLILMRALAALVLFPAQGLAVAATAVALGDPGPRYDGRLTASPFAHLDLLGLVGIVLFGLGWSKPVAVNPGELRSGRAGLVAVVLAGTLGPLTAAVALHLLTAPALTTLPLSGGLVAAAFLRTAAALCLANALFNLLPVPPLVGGHLLRALGVSVPAWLARLFPVALLALAGTGLARALIGPAEAVLGPLLIGAR
jgi:Zn-dependent protease